MLLAIETSTNICSVVFQNSEGVFFEERNQGRTVHSEKLFLSIEKLMKDHSFSLSDLDAVVVSNGPGSYTGLRISASGIKGLLFEEPCALYIANTLSSFALSAFGQDSEKKRIHSVMDARRTHLYYQQFDIVNGKIIAQSEVVIKELEEINAYLNTGDLIIGTGIERLNDALTSECLVLDESYISASSLISLYHNYRDTGLIEETTVQNFEPNYYTSNQVSNSMTKSS